ncbi:MAG: site-specific DNA-methyltransferase, partial [Clostridia bacterium]|nr:site-specific DNA-methyltransferase [Clostridia bacterium]
MIKETVEKNFSVKANSRGLEILKSNFPQCFGKDGKFDWKLFEDYIRTEEIDVKKEGYTLDFLGKSYARYLAGLDSETVIVPDECNKDTDSQNVYIVGDNLDALQHLKYSYSGQIKCIYIDPPYNTGSDGFVYNDKFEFTAEDLARKINIEEDEARRILDMQGKSTHSAWLSFMYPRLEIARGLLSDGGVIFISIDDNEQANLKLMCDAVFGEGNFVANIVWKSKSGGANDSKFVAVDHEYILMYCKNADKFTTNLIGYNSELETLYSGRDEYYEERGPYRPMLLQQKGLNFSKSLTYEIEAPDGSILTPEKGGAIWRWSKDRFLRAKEQGFVEFKKVNGEYKVYTKQYMNVDYAGNKFQRGGLL